MLRDSISIDEAKAWRRDPGFHRGNNSERDQSDVGGVSHRYLQLLEDTNTTLMGRIVRLEGEIFALQIEMDALRKQVGEHGPLVAAAAAK